VRTARIAIKNARNRPRNDVAALDPANSVPICSPEGPAHDLRPSLRPVICLWGKTHSNGSTMTDDGGKADKTAGGLARKASRQDRLKQALRENLKRRKSQARGRSDAAGAPSNSDDGPPHVGGGKKYPGM
jgi:hypothetical protein